MAAGTKDGSLLLLIVIKSVSGWKGVETAPWLANSRLARSRDAPVAPAAMIRYGVPNASQSGIAHHRELLTVQGCVAAPLGIPRFW